MAIALTLIAVGVLIAASVFLGLALGRVAQMLEDFEQQ